MACLDKAPLRGETGAGGPVEVRGNARLPHGGAQVLVPRGPAGARLAAEHPVHHAHVVV